MGRSHYLPPNLQFAATPQTAKLIHPADEPYPKPRPISQKISQTYPLDNLPYRQYNGHHQEEIEKPPP
jgi:hypothetical protein